MNFRTYNLGAMPRELKTQKLITVMKTPMPLAVQTKLAGLVSILCFLMVHTPIAFAEERPAQAVSVETIVSKLVAANRQRAQDLRGYRGKRLYHLDYHGFLGTHSAQLEVEFTYTAPDKKDFRVISESGAKVLINRVLLRLLDSEKEAFQQQNRQRMDLNPQNYKFTFVGTEPGPRGNYYILSVEPHEKTKFLYVGKIWVDPTDFAVTRMEGEPAKNPSFWISRTKIEYTWTKIGEFWLPAHNQSITQVRLGGTAVLTIDYTDYHVTGSGPNGAPRGGDKSTLPDPSSVTPNQR
ncbi:MAG: hypothetical protein ACHP8A_02870 [Terriglobales bacterium]|jgi:hypothetical protein|nr:hypothetical protein [Terriglobales bacterium]